MMVQERILRLVAQGTLKKICILYLYTYIYLSFCNTVRKKKKSIIFVTTKLAKEQSISEVAKNMP